jgi:hypothetical protein
MKKRRHRENAKQHTVAMRAESVCTVPGASAARKAVSPTVLLVLEDLIATPARMGSVEKKLLGEGIAASMVARIPPERLRPLVTELIARQLC